MIGPAPIRTVPIDWPKVAGMMAPKAVVPAVSLAPFLQVVARATAVLPIPFFLVDREAVTLILVRQLLHEAIDVHWLARVELPKVHEAVWV